MPAEETNPSPLEQGGGYLRSRGYTDAAFEEEKGRVVVLPSGSHSLESMDFNLDQHSLGWICYSMSGALVGIQIRSLEEKKYRFLQAKNVGHLPILYGTEKDYEFLWEKEEVFLVEGPFDRVALKRCTGDRAVFARMSKGAGGQMISFLSRYARRVWLVFDMDEPGRDATEKTERRFKDNTEVLSLEYPAHDPADLLMKYGEPRAREILAKKIEIQEF